MEITDISSSNVAIINELQNNYPEVDNKLLINYLYELIKIEYLRYNNDINYFNKNFENILLENKILSTKLDLAIDQAIFITLQPLKSDINSKDIEQIMLGWNGYLLNRDTKSGEYPSNIIHYFDNNLMADFRKMSPSEMREALEFDKMVACEKKEQCTKVLSKKINKIMTRQSKMSDDKYDNSMGILNYRFLRIHPFHDGNGRVSRMLINYMLNMRQGYYPIALDNNEIETLIAYYQEASRIIYTAYMGTYLSDLEYDDRKTYFDETEQGLTQNISGYLKSKQSSAQKILKI